MRKQLIQILFFLLILEIQVSGQEISYRPGYQTIMMTNPAFTGSEGNGTLRISYFNFFPGNNIKLHSVFFSYDTFLPVIHGGAGFYVSDNYLGGIINDLRGGFAYAYHLRAEKNFFINVGLAASFYHRGFNLNNVILPDQIDPLNGVFQPSGEIISNPGQTVIDLSTGFLFITDKIYGGLSINHLAEPDISGSGLSVEKLRRKLTIDIAGSFDLNKNYNLMVRPILSGEIQSSHYNTEAGVAIESNTLSVNGILLGNSSGGVDIQTGFSLRKGIIIVFYNYRFNVASKNKLLPVSLLHNTGFVINLNNVDKRKIIKTINFPKL